MVPLTALWPPILLSAIIVFVASSIMHMLLPYHRSDYQRLPAEDKLLVALRSAGLKRGLYIFPFWTPEQWHLEGSAVERDLQGSYRWTRLRLTDRRHLWLAVAPLTPWVGKRRLRGFVQPG